MWPEDDIATVGARKVRNSNSKNSGGLILTLLNLAASSDRGLVSVFSDLNIASETSIVSDKYNISINLNTEYL